MPGRERCSECDVAGADLIEKMTRRHFVQAAGAGVAALALPRGLRADESAANVKDSESLVKKLYESLSEKQREEVCFNWDYTDDRKVLRTHVSNNWQITNLKSCGLHTSFFTADQKDMIEALFWGLYNKDWHDRIRKQLQDDAKGYGKEQTIALFGKPGGEKFEFVMTGRHLTIRCDGNTTEHVAFGGPIFYGHAASGFTEKVGHPSNVFWPQAVKANELFKMLDGKQREAALFEKMPSESAVAFRGKEKIAGLPASELSKDQREHLQGVLNLLVEPYRVSDQQEVTKCLEAQGGLDQVRLSFYREADLGNDGIWDNWRLEGPSFVWHFRGTPHVHVWVNVADDPSVATNAHG
ncbi:MAG: DUF3500 domain-containing protein [Planctomycetaceae bacterium]